MILRADNIIKYYGKKAVVKGVSVQVKQGEIVGLLGPKSPTISPCFTSTETPLTTALFP